MLAGLGGTVAGVGGCRSPPLPVPVTMSLLGQSPSSIWASGTCHEPGGEYLGQRAWRKEAKPGWRSSKRTRELVWQPPWMPGVRCSDGHIYTTVSSALNKRFPLGGFYEEVQRAVKSLVQLPIVGSIIPCYLHFIASLSHQQLLTQ